MTLCEMQIVEHTETVLQMQDNWYLVYSPVSFTQAVINAVSFMHTVIYAECHLC